MRSVMVAVAFGVHVHLAVAGGCVAAACSRPVATPSMARLTAPMRHALLQTEPGAGMAWQMGEGVSAAPRLAPTSMVQSHVSCGVRAHAQLPAVDIKSTPLTTRAN